MNVISSPRPLIHCAPFLSRVHSREIDPEIEYRMTATQCIYSILTKNEIYKREHGHIHHHHRRRAANINKFYWQERSATMRRYTCTHAQPHWGDTEWREDKRKNPFRTKRHRTRNKWKRQNKRSYTFNHKFQYNLRTQNATRCENHMRWSWSALLFDLCSPCPLHLIRIIVCWALRASLSLLLIESMLQCPESRRATLRASASIYLFFSLPLALCSQYLWWNVMHVDIAAHCTYYLFIFVLEFCRFHFVSILKLEVRVTNAQHHNMAHTKGIYRRKKNGQPIQQPSEGEKYVRIQKNLKREKWNRNQESYSRRRVILLLFLGAPNN